MRRAARFVHLGLLGVVIAVLWFPTGAKGDSITSSSSVCNRPELFRLASGFCASDATGALTVFTESPPVFNGTVTANKNAIPIVPVAVTSSSSGGHDISTSNAATRATGDLTVFTNSPPVFNGTVTATKNGAPIPIAPVAPITVGFFFKYTYGVLPLGPSTPQQAANIAKVPGDMAEATSTSVGTPTPLGTPTSFADAFMFVKTNRDTLLDAVTDVTINKDAFARAQDPLYFSSGFTRFDDTLTNLSLDSSSPSSFAGHVMTATSTIPGLEFLYFLQIHVSGILSSLSDVQIEFQSNPLLGLNDVAFENALRADLSLTGNQVDLINPLQLEFSLNSPASYSVNFIDDSYSHANETPEPSTLLLLGSAVTGLASIRYYRRKNFRRGTRT